MVIPTALSWILTVVFLFLLAPPLLRLTRVHNGQSSVSARNSDAAEILLTLAMIAMVSPVGGPIPAVGWEAVLGGAALWFVLAWLKAWRTKNLSTARHRNHPYHLDDHHHGHHAISAIAMVYMIAAMAHHHSSTHRGVTDPWFTMPGMSTVDTSVGSGTLGLFPPLALILIAYFVIDAARSGMVVFRGGEVLRSLASRFGCRGVMGLGMSYMLVVAL